MSEHFVDIGAFFKCNATLIVRGPYVSMVPPTTKPGQQYKSLYNIINTYYLQINALLRLYKIRGVSLSGIFKQVGHGL